MNDLGLRLSANWTGVRCLLCLGAVLLAFGGGYWVRAMTEGSSDYRARTAAERAVLTVLRQTGADNGD